MEGIAHDAVGIHEKPEPFLDTRIVYHLMAEYQPVGTEVPHFDQWLAETRRKSFRLADHVRVEFHARVKEHTALSLRGPSYCGIVRRAEQQRWVEKPGDIPSQNACKHLRTGPLARADGRNCPHIPCKPFAVLPLEPHLGEGWRVGDLALPRRGREVQEEPPVHAEPATPLPDHVRLRDEHRRVQIPEPFCGNKGVFGIRLRRDDELGMDEAFELAPLAQVRACREEPLQEPPGEDRRPAPASERIENRPLEAMVLQRARKIVDHHRFATHALQDLLERPAVKRGAVVEVPRMGDVGDHCYIWHRISTSMATSFLSNATGVRKYGRWSWPFSSRLLEISPCSTGQ